MRKLSHRELVARQTAATIQPRLPISVVLNNVRSLYNVGSIFRTADGAGIEKIWLCGITGKPGSRRSRIEKTALGAEKTVPWEYREDARSIIRELKEKNYQIVLLEQTEKSVSYAEFQPAPPVCLVVGNEITGVSESLLPFCDAAIEIEMSGLKNSLNVTVAFGIVAYHFRTVILSEAKNLQVQILRPSASG